MQPEMSPSCKRWGRLMPTLTFQKGVGSCQLSPFRRGSAHANSHLLEGGDKEDGGEGEHGVNGEVRK